MVRVPHGDNSRRENTPITVAHDGVSGEYLYFDFFEIAIPSSPCRRFGRDARHHARHRLGHGSFDRPGGRAHGMASAQAGISRSRNHYVGAMWFYELCRRITATLR
jgi:hypothetical protein